MCDTAHTKIAEQLPSPPICHAVVQRAGIRRHREDSSTRVLFGDKRRLDRYNPATSLLTIRSQWHRCRSLAGETETHNQSQTDMAKGTRQSDRNRGGRASGVTDIAGEVRPLPLDSLRYDPKNPRIVEQIGENPTQPQIQALLLGDEMKARELVPSFIENGYIPCEPLIVRPFRGEHIVIEGNRRLAALRSMVESDEPEERQAVERFGLTNPPCLLFEGDEKQLLAYLGLRHLSKTKDWGTSAKAAFVERVLRAGFDLPNAGRLTNVTTSALRLMLLTRRLFVEANELGLDLTSAGAEGETIFWHLGDAIRRTNTKKYLSLEENANPLNAPSYDQSKFENLIAWLYGNSKTRQMRIIGSIRDIASLDQCLGNERARRALENGANIEEAKAELEAAGATIAGHIERAQRSIERATGGPILFYQAKNSTFDLKEHPEEFGRIPEILHDWFGRRWNQSRCVVPVLATNTVLTLEMKDRIFTARGSAVGTHLIDAVDIVCAEFTDDQHACRRHDCSVY